MLRFLATCIKFGGKVEWNIMKRRHVWDSLCSMYAATPNLDANVKRAIEDIFIQVTQKPDLAFRVVVRYAWLNYAIQVLATRVEGEMKHSRQFWTQCIANLLESIDLVRLGNALGSTTCFSSFSRILEIGDEYSKVNGEPLASSSDVPYTMDVARIAARLRGQEGQSAKDLYSKAVKVMVTNWKAIDPSEIEDAILASGRDNVQTASLAGQFKRNIEVVLDDALINGLMTEQKEVLQENNVEERRKA
jgi:hypothetical protein